MKKLIIGLLLLSVIAIQARDASNYPDPNCVIAFIAKLKNEKHARELFLKEKGNLNHNMFSYFLKYVQTEYQLVNFIKGEDFNRKANQIITLILIEKEMIEGNRFYASKEEISARKKNLETLTKQFKSIRSKQSILEQKMRRDKRACLMAKFYREKLNKFNAYSIEDQSLLLAEAELHLSLLLGLQERRKKVFEAVLDHKDYNKEVAEGQLLKVYIELINCMNKAPQKGDTAKHDIACVAKVI